MNDRIIAHLFKFFNLSDDFLWYLTIQEEKANPLYDLYDCCLSPHNDIVWSNIVDKTVIVVR